MSTDDNGTATPQKSVCTVAIFHTEEQKRALYEILDRMSCETCEISSLSDLLAFVEHSDLAYLQFAENPNEQSPRQYVIDYPNRHGEQPGSSQKSGRPPIGFSRKTDLMTLQEIEKIHITNTLRRCGWMYKLTAKELGIDRTTLYRKMKRYGIERDDAVEPL